MIYESQDYDPYECNDEYPAMRSATYSCPDRMCGALDCANCHPELQGTHSCDCCGAVNYDWADWCGEDNNLCPDCIDMVICEVCGGWFHSEDEEEICPDCMKDIPELVDSQISSDGM